MVEVLDTSRKFLGASISEKNDKADNVGDTETHSQGWRTSKQTQLMLNHQFLYILFFFFFITFILLRFLQLLLQVTNVY